MLFVCDPKRSQRFPDLFGVGSADLRRLIDAQLIEPGPAVFAKGNRGFSEFEPDSSRLAYLADQEKFFFHIFESDILAKQTRFPF